jgi:hypothetical protein
MESAAAAAAELPISDSKKKHPLSGEKGKREWYCFDVWTETEGVGREGKWLPKKESVRR